MQGNVVSAARWLGASLVVAGVILVVGIHWSLSSLAGRWTVSGRESIGTSEIPVKSISAADPDAANSPQGPAYRPARVQELLSDAEKLRAAGEDWDRFWFVEQPSHMTPFRTHGGLGP